MKTESNMRRTVAKNVVLTTSMLVAALFSTTCQKKQAAPTRQISNSPSPISTPQAPPSPEVHTYHGTGIVTKVVRENPYDKSLASVELNHGEIVGLMPAMRMEFYVKSVSLLDGIKVGDTVDFTIEEKGSTEIVSEITKK